MQEKPINGVIVHPDGARHDDYLFRVSLKALIFNERGEVLIVKESGRVWWDIPGGGLDHGESVKGALARELQEEVGYTGDFDYDPLLVEDAHVLKSANVYQMRAVFLVTPANYDFVAGEDGDEVMFIDAEQFKDSDLVTERQIYQYGQLGLRRLGVI